MNGPEDLTKRQNKLTDNQCYYQRAFSFSYLCWKINNFDCIPPRKTRHKKQQVKQKKEISTCNTKKLKSAPISRDKLAEKYIDFETGQRNDRYPGCTIWSFRRWHLWAPLTFLIFQLWNLFWNMLFIHLQDNTFHSILAFKDLAKRKWVSSVLAYKFQGILLRSPVPVHKSNTRIATRISRSIPIILKAHHKAWPI